MPYTTESSVRKASGFSDSVNITSALIVAYIADADSVINSSIVTRYSLPLSETPDIIETLSRHITVGLLYSNEYGEESQDTDKGWKSRLDWAMNLLNDIKEGKLQLLDSNFDELARNSLLNISSKPNDASSAVDASDSDAPKLTMNEKF